MHKLLAKAFFNHHLDENLYSVFVRAYTPEFCIFKVHLLFTILVSFLCHASKINSNSSAIQLEFGCLSYEYQKIFDIETLVAFKSKAKLDVLYQKYFDIETFVACKSKAKLDVL